MAASVASLMHFQNLQCILHIVEARLQIIIHHDCILRLQKTLTIAVRDNHRVERVRTINILVSICSLNKYCSAECVKCGRVLSSKTRLHVQITKSLPGSREMSGGQTTNRTYKTLQVQCPRVYLPSAGHLTLPVAMSDLARNYIHKTKLMNRAFERLHKKELDTIYLPSSAVLHNCSLPTRRIFAARNPKSKYTLKANVARKQRAIRRLRQNKHSARKVQSLMKEKRWNQIGKKAFTPIEEAEVFEIAKIALQMNNRQWKEYQRDLEDHENGALAQPGHFFRHGPSKLKRAMTIDDLSSWPKRVIFAKFSDMVEYTELSPTKLLRGLMDESDDEEIDDYRPAKRVKLAPISGNAQAKRPAVKPHTMPARRTDSSGIVKKEIVVIDDDDDEADEDLQFTRITRRYQH